MAFFNVTGNSVIVRFPSRGGMFIRGGVNVVVLTYTQAVITYIYIRVMCMSYEL